MQRKGKKERQKKDHDVIQNEQALQAARRG